MSEYIIGESRLHNIIISISDIYFSGNPNVAITMEESHHIPENPVITNLNSLLSDIHVRFIKLTDFDTHYRVFDTIFQAVHKKMKEVDPYYQKYSSTVRIPTCNLIIMSIFQKFNARSSIEEGLFQAANISKIMCLFT